MAPRKQGGIFVARSRQVMTTVPGLLGYSNLETPDTYDPDKPKFTLDLHMNEDQVDRFVDQVDEQCIGGMMAELRKEVTKGGKPESFAAALEPVSARRWVLDSLKQPKNDKPFPLPFMKLAGKAKGKNRDGEEYDKRLTVWDAANNILDLHALRLGRGSVIQAVVKPGLWISPLVKQPTPTLELTGLRVITLVQWGGGAVDPGTLDDRDLETLGEDVAVEDLSAFAAGSGEKAKAAGTKGALDPGEFPDDDEIPF